MDEETVLADRPQGDDLAGRPLVTFALFAYNQEQYVREAIEAAFAQTYSPLEIILSDDCSSDATFSIMQEMAAAYSGPHQVVARQSPRNRRVLRHVLDVARLARGKYMVVAAGDDISLPQRTEALVEVFEQDGADFCWSAYASFHEGEIEKRYLAETYSLKSEIYGMPVDRIYGATAAYRTAVINLIPSVDHDIFYEDSFLEIFAALSGFKVAFCPKELVEYRLLETSLSMKFLRDGSAFERRLALHVERLSATVILAINTFRAAESSMTRKELAHCLRLAHFYQSASVWESMTALDRIRLLLQAPDGRSMKWFLPRALLGWRLFVRLKNVQLNHW